MTGRSAAPEPSGEPHVPDAVLDELSAAFADDKARGFDFDDPSIDRLLGIGVPAPDDVDDIEDDDEIDDEIDDDADEVEDDEVEPDVEAEEDEPADPSPPRKTIVIADDPDQPDTVYLDQEKEERFLAVHASADGDDADGERSTILIGDLDDGVVVEPAPTKGSAGIDPRIRARRIAVRRSEGRRRLVWVGVAVGVVVVVVGVIAALASPLFDVSTVDVEGAVYTDPELIQRVVDDVKGDPVLLVDEAAIEEQLEADAWVERAKVTSSFPHTVTIELRERQPLATFEGGDGKWRVIDIDGRVLDVIDGVPVAYMLITGDHPDTARGQFAGAPYADAALLVQALPSEIRVITESVGLDPATGNLTMQLAGGVEVVLGSADDLDGKLARLLSQVRGGLEGVVSLDVSTSEIGVIRG